MLKDKLENSFESLGAKLHRENLIKVERTHNPFENGPALPFIRYVCSFLHRFLLI
jgi:hypothetical protein